MTQNRYSARIDYLFPWVPQVASRVAVVFVAPGDLHWRSFTEGWLAAAALPAAHAWRGLLVRFVENLQNFVAREL
jgi:hypothetical protein